MTPVSVTAASAGRATRGKEGMVDISNFQTWISLEQVIILVLGSSVLAEDIAECGRSQ